MTTLTKTYEPLTETTAIELAIKLHFFENSTSINCKEIGDGNLNFVFHLTDENNKGVIIKQALPYAKVVGESWPLTLKRALIESNSLKEAAKHVPSLVPTVYYTDEHLAITVMEDLSHLTISRTGLMNGEDYPLLSEHIGQFLAKTLFYTSDFGLNQQKKKLLQQQFANPELCKITEDLVFTDPFYDSETNNFERELLPFISEIWNDSSLKLEVAKLKYSFLTKGEALLHGDLHTGSIFASNDETKVIDPEFAFFGPIGFDVGQFFANLIVNAISREQKKQGVIFDHIQKTWDVFTTEFSKQWALDSVEYFTKTEGYLSYVFQSILEDTIGYAGCELIRRTIGLAHVADLDNIPSIDKRLEAKTKALQLGKYFILNRANIHSVEDFIQVSLQHVQQ